jgi:16S rRNA (guanine527-N7)-methyltransferase
MNKDVFKQKFRDLLENINLEIEDNQLNMYWEYMNFLLQENNKYNLTAIDKPEEILKKHFLDSLTICNEIVFKGDEYILDVGTGAGFPGLVLKIFYPDLKLVLLDSRLKRINFLKMLIIKLEQLSINDFGEDIETIHERAENLGQTKEYRNKFDLVVSRAVASLNVLYEYTIPFVKKGKHVILYKGPNYKKEIVKAENALLTLGGNIKNIKEINILDILEKRYLINIEKTSLTPDSYPRREGIPKKRPL